MAWVGERQVTGENGGVFQTEKAGYALVMEAFWLSDKFRIRAVILSLSSWLSED